MSYRTNRSTRGIFKVSRATVAAITRNLPAETKAYRDYARAVGLKTRIQSKRIGSLKWRGFPMGEELVANDRLEYLKSHLETLPLIVIDGKTGDIIDGNHRYHVFKEKGYKTVPVLALSGPEAGMDAIEDFAQNWNNNAEWENLTERDYAHTMVKEMSEGVRCEYCGNLRDRCSCVTGGLK